MCTRQEGVISRCSEGLDLSHAGCGGSEGQEQHSLGRLGLLGLGRAKRVGKPCQALLALHSYTPSPFFMSLTKRMCL